jgi:hypothetical protein
LDHAHLVNATLKILDKWHATHAESPFISIKLFPFKSESKGSTYIYSKESGVVKTDVNAIIKSRHIKTVRKVLDRKENPVLVSQHKAKAKVLSVSEVTDLEVKLNYARPNIVSFVSENIYDVLDTELEVIDAVVNEKIISANSKASDNVRTIRLFKTEIEHKHELSDKDKVIDRLAKLIESEADYKSELDQIKAIINDSKTDIPDTKEIDRSEVTSYLTDSLKALSRRFKAIENCKAKLGPIIAGNEYIKEATNSIISSDVSLSYVEVLAELLCRIVDEFCIETGEDILSRIDNEDDSD